MIVFIANASQTGGNSGRNMKRYFVSDQGRAREAGGFGMKPHGSRGRIIGGATAREQGRYDASKDIAGSRSRKPAWTGLCNSGSTIGACNHCIGAFEDNDGARDFRSRASCSRLRSCMSTESWSSLRG